MGMGIGNGYGIPCQPLEKRSVYTYGSDDLHLTVKLNFNKGLLSWTWTEKCNFHEILLNEKKFNACIMDGNHAANYHCIITNFLYLTFYQV